MITIKLNSIKPANHRRQSAAGGIRLQRIYPSSAPGRTCIVSDSGGHQSRLRRTGRRISRRISRPQPPAIPPLSWLASHFFLLTSHLLPPFPPPTLFILYISNRKSPCTWNTINYAKQTQFSDEPTDCNTGYDKHLQ
jgi:hypothetical protein